MSPAGVITIGPEALLGPATCTVGAAGPALFAVNYLLPPNDRFFTLLQCADCPAPDSTKITDVHVALHFVTACSQPIEIAVVGARGDTACRAPDTFNLLAAPQAFTLSSGAPGDYEFVLPLSPPARFAGDAFLCVNFVADGSGCATLETRPELLTNGACSPCRSWNYSVAGEQDVCAVSLPGQPVMYAVAGSCAVPVRARSWGSIKLLYR